MFPVSVPVWHTKKGQTRPLLYSLCLSGAPQKGQTRPLLYSLCLSGEVRKGRASPFQARIRCYHLAFFVARFPAPTPPTRFSYFPISTKGLGGENIKSKHTNTYTHKHTQTHTNTTQNTNNTNNGQPDANRDTAGGEQPDATNGNAGRR